MLFPTDFFQLPFSFQYAYCKTLPKECIQWVTNLPLGYWNEETQTFALNTTAISMQDELLNFLFKINSNSAVTEYFPKLWPSLEFLFAHAERFTSKQDVDTLLMMALSNFPSLSYIEDEENRETAEQTMHHEIIRHALDHGATLHWDEEIFEPNLYAVLSSIDLLINHPSNPLSALDLLILLVITPQVVSATLEGLRVEYVESFLKKEDGWKELTLKDHQRHHSLYFYAVYNELYEIADLLRAHGATCFEESWRFTQALEEAKVTSLFGLGAQSFMQTIAKTINEAAEPTAKIPAILHQIWLTHSHSPHEIHEKDRLTILENRHYFSSWTHILWTNDRALIPETVAYLEAKGIEIRNIDDYVEAFPHASILYDLIALKHWGLASDLLRYMAISHYGGAYADLNFRFSRAIDHDCHIFDFFADSINNCFFAAKPHHPILEDIVTMVIQNIEQPPLHIRTIPESDIFQKTLYTSLYPFGFSFVKYAFQKGNRDIIYPYFPSFPEEVVEGLTGKLQHINGNTALFSQFMHFDACPVHKNFEFFPFYFGMCLSNDYNIGDDNLYSAVTWIENS